MHSKNVSAATKIRKFLKFFFVRFLVHFREFYPFPLKGEHLIACNLTKTEKIPKKGNKKASIFFFDILLQENTLEETPRIKMSHLQVCKSAVQSTSRNVPPTNRASIISKT